MRRFQVMGMVGAAALLAGWIGTAAAGAGDEAVKEVRRPGKRVEVMRMLGGGGRLWLTSVPEGAPAAGWTTSPAGLFTTISVSSS